MGMLAGKLWARLLIHSGHVLPSFPNKANSSCVLHIPPVNKRSETKRVLVQLATEGWGGGGALLLSRAALEVYNPDLRLSPRVLGVLHRK